MATIQGVYIALFGRPADPTGLAFFNGVTKNGADLSGIGDLASTKEYQDRFTGLNNIQIVNSIYQSLFGRNAETAGLNFFVDALNKGTLNINNIAIAILDGAQGSDKTIVDNKVAAANLFTAGIDTPVETASYMGNAAADLGRAFISGISTTAATQAQVDAALKGVVDAASGTGVTGQTFTLTTALDALTGTANNDTFTGTLDAAAGKSTINLGDSVNGGAGTDTFNILSNLAGANTANGITLTSVEVINVNNTVAGAANTLTVDASVASGLTNINATGVGDVKVTNIGSAALGVNGVTSNNGAAQTVTAAGANTLNVSGTTVGSAAGSALNVDISGGASTGIPQAVVVNSNGTASNVLSNLKVGNLVDGASSLTVHAAAGFKTTVTEAVANSLKTVVIDGATTGTVDLGTLGSTALKSVDASGLTAGGAKVGIGANTATTFTGGAGNDTVTIADGVAMAGAAGSINAGAGTGDKLAISDAFASGAGIKADASLTAATKGIFTNFEVLSVSSNTGGAAGAAGDHVTFDSSLLSGLTSLEVGASNYGIELSNLGANSTTKVVGSVTGADGLILTLKDATGASDVANVTFDNGATNAAVKNNGVSLTDLKAVGVETLNIHSNGLVTNGGTANTVTLLDAANTSMSKVVIDGSQAFSLTTGNHAVALTIDGSAATGQLTLNAGAAATALVNINGGSAADTITASTKGGLIAGNGGGDQINLGAGADTVVVKTATDSLQDFVNASGTSKATMDTIAAFTSGADKIDLTSLGFTSNTTKLFVDKNFAGTAALTTAEAASSFFQDATNTTRGAVLAHDTTNNQTYLVVDSNHDGVFNASTDTVIHLAGAVALAQGDIVWG